MNLYPDPVSPDFDEEDAAVTGVRVRLSMIAEHEPGDIIAGVELELLLEELELELVPKRHP